MTVFKISGDAKIVSDFSKCSGVNTSHAKKPIIYHHEERKMGS